MASAVQLQSHQTEHSTLLKPFDFHQGNKSEQRLLVVGCCAKIRSLFTSSPQIMRRGTKGFFVASRVPSDHRRTPSRRGGRNPESQRWRDRWASCATVSYQASHRRLKGFSHFPTTGVTKTTAGYILASRNRNNLPLLILSGGRQVAPVEFLTLFDCQTRGPKFSLFYLFYLHNLHIQRISLLSYAMNDIRLANNKLYRLITLWNVDCGIMKYCFCS